MTLWEDLQNKRVGRLTYLQFIVLMVGLALICYFLVWIVDEASKPPPEMKIGSAVGYFHGKTYGWYATAQISQEAKERGCFNSSWLLFWGNITYQDGSSEDVSVDGRRIEGLICREYVDSRKWMSTDLSHRTDIRFSFIGQVKPYTQINVSNLLQDYWGVIPLALFIWAYWLRKWSRPKFDTAEAKKIFKHYKQQLNIMGLGKINVVTVTDVNNEYWVGQRIESDDNPYWLVLRIDNTRSIREEIHDDTGDTWRAIFDKEGLLFRRELMKDSQKITLEESYDMLNNYQQRERQRRLPTQPTRIEKEKSIRDMIGEVNTGRDEINERPKER